MHKLTIIATFVISLILCFPLTHGLLQRCYSCRSRGELGSCKDPLPKNVTDKAVESVPCASGWCGKMLETENAQKEEYGVATQRRCLQRGPSDNEERCAYTKIDYKQVYMCFCKGDLCNNATFLTHGSVLMSLVVLYSMLNMLT